MSEKPTPLIRCDEVLDNSPIDDRLRAVIDDIGWAETVAQLKRHVGEAYFEQLGLPKPEELGPKYDFLKTIVDQLMTSIQQQGSLSSEQESALGAALMSVALSALAMSMRGAPLVQLRPHILALVDQVLTSQLTAIVQLDPEAFPSAPVQ